MGSLRLRSISLPSNSHPVTASLDELLNKLKISQPSSIGHKLEGLKKLHDCVDDFLQLPLTRQALSYEAHKQCVEEALNGSLRLLDICSTTRDFFSQMKERVQGLELSLRRRRGGEFSLDEVHSYMVSRKKSNRLICKYLKNLKSQEYNCNTSATSSDNNDRKNMISMLKDAEQTSVSVFESILSFISQPKAKSKPSGWSVVSKLLKAKNSSSEAQMEANEMEKIHAELLVFKSSKDMNMAQTVLKGLEALEMSLQEVVEELECTYRRLVKTRVSLLNILNH